MSSAQQISILGGGVAGLAAGHFARQRELPFCVYEAAPAVGGLSQTYARGAFRFDSGAHRFHDRAPEITACIRGLLGEELARIEIPSVIHRQGRVIDFPLSPLNLLRRLGPRTVLGATGELVLNRVRRSQPPADLEAFAVRAYGRTVADFFLLNYSRKLWGLDCRELSPQAAGKRLKGLTLATFLKEAAFGRRAKTRHLDGEFFYPSRGIGRIAERLCESCGPARVRTGAEVTRLRHDGRAIRELEINGGERIGAGAVVTTLPLTVLLSQLDPPPPPEVAAVARELRFRDLILVALFFAVPRLTEVGTIYFPDPEVPFTRIYEPKNRSPAMAPADRTSLVAELPCDAGGPVLAATDDELVELVRSHLARVGLIRPERVTDACVVRLPNAYPVLHRGVEVALARIETYLRQFSNLRSCGRSALFAHASLHDVIHQGRQVIEALVSGGGSCGVGA